MTPFSSRVARWLLSLFSLEAQCYAAAPAYIEVTAANLRAKQLLGERGNVVVNGDWICVGVGNWPEFVEMSRGLTAASALESIERDEAQ